VTNAEARATNAEARATNAEARATNAGANVRNAQAKRANAEERAVETQALLDAYIERASAERRRADRAHRTALLANRRAGIATSNAQDLIRGTRTAKKRESNATKRAAFYRKEAEDARKEAEDARRERQVNVQAVLNDHVDPAFLNVGRLNSMIGEVKRLENERNKLNGNLEDALSIINSYDVETDALAEKIAEEAAKALDLEATAGLLRSQLDQSRANATKNKKRTNDAKQENAALRKTVAELQRRVESAPNKTELYLLRLVAAGVVGFFGVSIFVPPANYRPPRTAKNKAADKPPKSGALSSGNLTNIVKPANTSIAAIPVYNSVGNVKALKEVQHFGRDVVIEPVQPIESVFRPAGLLTGPAGPPAVSPASSVSPKAMGSLVVLAVLIMYLFKKVRDARKRYAPLRDVEYERRGMWNVPVGYEEDRKRRIEKAARRETARLDTLGKAAEKAMKVAEKATVDLAKLAAKSTVLAAKVAAAAGKGVAKGVAKGVTKGVATVQDARRRRSSTGSTNNNAYQDPDGLTARGNGFHEFSVKHQKWMKQQAAQLGTGNARAKAQLPYISWRAEQKARLGRRPNRGQTGQW
jgi:hypothetical protein